MNLPHESVCLAQDLELGLITSLNPKYGLSNYLKAFDPYGLTNPKGNSFMALAFIRFTNATKVMKRFADVARRYADLITDNFLVARAEKALEAIHGLFAVGV